MPTSSNTEPTDIGRSFVAIDFETATSQRNSACAVGVVVFERGAPTNTLSLLIRPPVNRYDDFNTMIHGICPSDTHHSPEFPEVWEQIEAMLNGRLVVAHNTAFDISVLRRSPSTTVMCPTRFRSPAPIGLLAQRCPMQSRGL